jgi:hypothetical protein
MLFTFGVLGFGCFFFRECCTIIGERSLVLPFCAAGLRPMRNLRLEFKSSAGQRSSPPLSISYFFISPPKFLLLLRDTKVNVEEGCIIRGGLRDG